MDRREKLTTGLDLRHSAGIEIGPLDRPIVRKEEGDILYVDHVDTASLKAKYRNDPSVDTARIPDVDAVWGEQTLQEAIGTQRKVDYVVASHVIEHVPDLLTWLEELHAVLKPGGEVRLAIPDRRFTFDHLRRETSLAEVIGAWLVRARRPQAIAILDHCLNAVRVNRVEAWDAPVNPAALEKFHTVADGIKLAQDSLENGNYHDVHCWVFTPRSFVALFTQAALAGLIRFACCGFHDTERHHDEFFVRLRVCDDPTEASESWRRMAHGAVSLEAPAEQQAALRREHQDRDSAERDRLRRELDDVLASTSWRLTAPLRRVVDAMRRRRRPPS